MAATAQADEESYLDRLRQDGINRPLPDGALVQNGHIICTNLERGVGPIDGAEDYFLSVGVPEMISAARSELCPETLR